MVKEKTLVKVLLILLLEPKNGDNAKFKCHFLKDSRVPRLVIEVRSALCLSSP